VQQQWHKVKLQNAELSSEAFFYNSVTRSASWTLPRAVKVTPLPAKIDATALEPPVQLELGSMVWVPDDDDVANAAFVEVPFAPGAKGSVKFDDGLVVQLMPEETASVLPMDQQVLDEKINDLITLDQLNEFAVLYKLRTRFEKDLIYTSVSSVLISINPCKQLDICGAGMMRKYKAGVSNENPKSEHLPHVFRVGLEAYESLLRDKRSQSILVSGESGAGKTEATKLLLKYLAEASDMAKRAASGESIRSEIPEPGVSTVGKKKVIHRRSTNIERPSLWTTGEGGESSLSMDTSGGESESLVHGLESQILQASPLLEAFGNAKTIRNHNSSRFGKMVSVKFNEAGYITGATIANYLLEKSRVTTQSANERNYHIFYQLLAGLSSASMDTIRPTDSAAADGGGQEANDSYDEMIKVLREQLTLPVTAVEAAEPDASSPPPPSTRLTRSPSTARVRMKELKREFVFLAGGADDDTATKVDVNFSSSSDEEEDEEEDEDEEGQMVVGRKADKQHDASDLLLFKETVEAMGALHIPADEINGVLSMLAAVLQAGNVDFEDEQEAAGRASMEEAANAGGGSRPAASSIASNNNFESHIQVSSTPQSSERFRRIATLLGVERNALERVLVSRQMGSGRGSTYQVFYTTEQARSNLDSMVKLVYSSLFNYLVAKVNQAFEQGMSQPVTAKAAASKHLADVHLLDIFGFEIFESNSFEQLCINYCNETLQQFFNRYIFMLEQEEYERQGIKIAAVEFEDNSECLELLQGTSGVFSMLNEEGKIPKGSDISLLNKILTKHQKHPNLERTHIKVLNARQCFSIRHFAGTVAYDVTSFLTKNKDHLHSDILDALTATTQPFVATIMGFQEGNTSTSGTGGDQASSSGGSGYSYSFTSKKKGKKADAPHIPKSAGSSASGGTTLISKFQSQISVLMQGLDETQPHFIRCLKPNDSLEPGKVDAVKLHYQLHRNGLLQVCKMRQIGYPIRVSHHLFYERFLPVAQAVGIPPSPSIIKALKDKKEPKAKKGKPGKSTRNMAANKGKSTLFSGVGGRFSWPATYTAPALDAILLFLHSLGALQTGQFARGSTKVFLRNAAQSRLHVWAQQAAWAGQVLTHFRLLVVARARYAYYKEQLAALMTVLRTRSLPRVQAQLQMIEQGNGAGKALPYGGWSTKEVKKAKAALPQLRLEEAAKGTLRAAVEARDMEGLKAALANAASFNQPTLDQSAEADGARTMMKLLVREEDLKAALAAATKENNIGELRTLLKEARDLRLLVDEEEDPEGVRSVLQTQQCVEVEDAVKAWNKVEAVIIKLRRMQQPGANLFKLKAVLEEARVVGLDKDTSSLSPISDGSKGEGDADGADADGADADGTGTDGAGTDGAGTDGADGAGTDDTPAAQETMTGSDLVRAVETMHEEELARMEKLKARLELLLQGKEGEGTEGSGGDKEGEGDSANMASVVGDLRRMAMQMDAAAVLIKVGTHPV
jgi:hypothetical protein